MIERKIREEGGRGKGRGKGNCESSKGARERERKNIHHFRTVENHPELRTGDKSPITLSVDQRDVNT